MGTKSDKDWAKSYASNFTISFGMVTVLGTLYPPKKPNSGKEEKFNLACPECVEASKMRQSYTCETDPNHGPYSNGECDHMKATDDGFIKVSDADIEEARTSDLVPNLLDLHIHKREELAGKLVTIGSSYVFRPPENMKMPYRGLIEGIKARPDLVFMGETNLRKADKLVCLEVGMDDQLLVSELAWPEDLATFTPEEVELAPQVITQFAMVAESSVEPFDAENYRKQSRERLAALTESSDAPKKPRPKADPTADLMAALEASLHAAQAS